VNFLFIYPSPGILGGVETLIARMSRWLVSHGHQVSVVVQRGDNWLGLLPKEVRSVVLGDRFPELYYYYHAKRFWKSAGLPRPDVIKSFHFGSSWIACQLGAIIGGNCKVIAGMYEPAVFKWYCAPDSLKPWSNGTLLLKNYLNSIPPNARLFCGIDQIEELDEIHGQKGILWPIPIDTTEFEPASRRPKWGRIVSIGRFAAMKEYNFYMIDVIENLRSRGHDVSWSVYGHGEYETAMREQIRSRGLEGAITIEGTVPYRRFRKVLEDAYVFVGMGTSVLEAALFKVPNVNALAYDRQGLTTGPVYRFPRGSIGPGISAPADLKVVDEIERILRLSPAEYRAEEERVGFHVEVHEMESSMKRFLELVQQAEPVTHGKFRYLANYPLWFIRRVMDGLLPAKPRGHPEAGQLVAKAPAAV
jgi:glycosyltransferase involved in cell wall biosynthesis